MKPAFRCTFDSSACPASGQIVGTTGQESEQDCPVCGRVLRLRPRWDDLSAAWFARLRTHKRLDAQVARRASGKARKAYDRARRALRAADKRSKSAARMVSRAQLDVDALPHQAAGREAWADKLRRAQHKLGAPRIPRASAAIVSALQDESSIDFGSVEPDNLVEHLSQGLTRRQTAELKRVPPGQRVKRGVVMAIRRSKYTTWDELESEPGPVGQLSTLGWLREFPGLEGLRAPGLDRAQVPF